MEKKAKHKADVWNQKYSEGQKVSLLKDGGEIITTKTRSRAWVMGCTAVALFEGISGAYSLDRATAL